MTRPDLETTKIAAPGAAVEDMLFLCRVHGGNHPVLFLHGSTIPASVALCVENGGERYLDLYAKQGFDAWCIDFRGFGRSYKPQNQSGPATSTQEAVQDVLAAIDHILAETGAARLSIVGWSWGSTVAATLATVEKSRIDRLVLISPQWLRDTPSPLVDNPAVLKEPYRKVSSQVVVERWLAKLSKPLRQEILSGGWADTFRAAMDAPGSGADTAPNGPLLEIHKHWSAGQPVYDPVKINVPVLIVLGAEDTETPARTVRGLFAELADHPDAQYLEISGASHFAPVEPRRQRIAGMVGAFLQ